MSNYIEKLNDDLAEQFRGKKNIEDLLEVVGQQLQEVFDFYQQLEFERNIYTAVGAQLDGVGDIACLSRRDAAIMSGCNEADLSDEDYRQFLIYEIMKNTCDCSYESLIKAIKMFWKGESSVTYREDAAHPATIILETEGFGEKANVHDLMTLPIIKAAGVGMHIHADTKMKIPTYIGVIQNQRVESNWKSEPYELANILTMPDGEYLTMPDGDILFMFGNERNGDDDI